MLRVWDRFWVPLLKLIFGEAYPKGGFTRLGQFFDLRRWLRMPLWPLWVPDPWAGRGDAPRGGVRDV